MLLICFLDCKMLFKAEVNIAKENIQKHQKQTQNKQDLLALGRVYEESSFSPVPEAHYPGKQILVESS